MKQFLKILYKLLDITKAITAFLAIVYAFFWFAYIFNFQFVQSIDEYLAPIANFTHLIVVHSFTFQNIVYDSTYIITALFCAFLFFVVSKTNEFVAGQIETETFKESLRKAQRDAKENIKVVKTFREHISKINFFVIYLNINLKFAINEILIDNKVDLKEQKHKNYMSIIEKMASRNTLKTELIDDKLGIICEDFKTFDKVFKDFLESLNQLNSDNAKCEITTDIYFVIDGCEQDAIPNPKRAYLKKILSFGYKNKAITTTLFAKRYEQEEERNYVLNTMGKIRFFEDLNEEDIENGHVDFELFMLRRKKQGA